MAAIALCEPLLVEETEQVAALEGKDAAQVVAESVRYYLAMYRQRRIAAETEAWYALPTDVRPSYAGRFVAVFGGKVVDRDSDRLTPYFRAREHAGRQPVLITEGGDQPIPVYRVHSPHRTRAAHAG
jgi:hypothetical protein